jgi:hypothetical protein
MAYLHEFVAVSEKPEVYDGKALEPRLNERGGEGWEMVHMEAHWEWGKSRATNEGTEPRRIIGWYVTYRRD